jgi:diguanylate cyclase (GGDEF)-like protein
MTDLQLVDEAGRIAALNRFCVLDSCRESQLDKITALVRSVLDVPIAALSLVDDDRQWFTSMDGLDVSETPRGIFFCKHTIMARTPMHVVDAHADDRFRDNPLVTGDPFIRAYLGAPLTTADGYNVGALCAIDRRPRQFSQSDKDLIATFAALVTDELELRLIAQRDNLTGAMSRKAFVQKVETLVHEQRPGTALILFDIDRLRSVNDRYGYPAGDEVIRGIAACVRARLCRNEHFGRLGGEEFGLLLNSKRPGEALERIEGLRQSISKLSHSIDPNIRVTASFGLVDLLSSETEYSMLQANAALHAAKRRGRNRTVSGSALLDQP